MSRLGSRRAWNGFGTGIRTKKDVGYPGFLPKCKKVGQGFCWIPFQPVFEDADGLDGAKEEVVTFERVPSPDEEEEEGGLH